MRILDTDRDTAVIQAQIYLSPKEAAELVKNLTDLLQDAEAREHHHQYSEDMKCEISYSLVTEGKIGGYTKREQKLLAENK